MRSDRFRAWRCEYHARFRRARVGGARVDTQARCWTRRPRTVPTGATPSSATGCQRPAVDARHRRPAPRPALAPTRELRTEMFLHEVRDQGPVLVNDVVADVVALRIADPPLRAARLLVRAIGIRRRDEVVLLAVHDEQWRADVLGGAVQRRARRLDAHVGLVLRAPDVAEAAQVMLADEAAVGQAVQPAARGDRT